MSTQLALCSASGLLIDLLQKLAGRDGEQWLKELKQFLRKEGVWRDILPFGTTTTGRSALDFLHDNYGCGDDHLRDVILGNDIVTTKGVSYSLVMIPACRFQLSSTRGVVEEAKKMGYQVAPLEVALIGYEYLTRHNFEDMDVQMSIKSVVVIQDPDGDVKNSISISTSDTYDEKVMEAHPISAQWSQETGFLFINKRAKKAKKKK